MSRSRARCDQVHPNRFFRDRKSSSMRRLAGPALLGVLALSFILGSLFKPFGLGGSGTDSGDEEPALSPQVQTTNGAQTTADPSPTPQSPPSTLSTTEITDAILPDDYPRPLRVSINEYQFAVQTSQQTTKIMPVEQLVLLIQNAPVDNSGIKARISRHASAQAKAEEDFKQLLEKAGIPSTAIVWEPDLIPETVQ